MSAPGTLERAASVPAPLGGKLMALAVLNFFLADSRDGLGPFLDAYLTTQGWRPMDLGLLATIGGVLGLAAGMPAGALADRSHHKRLMIIAPVTLITVMSMLCIAFPGRAVVFSTQTLAALAGVLIMPALSGITLGLVGPKRFGEQLGRNEAYNHGGNMVLLGATWGASAWFGLPGVAVLMLATTIATVAATLAIDPHAIDHVAARGGECGGERGEHPPASTWRVLVHNRPLLLLSVALLLFHFGNAPLARLISQQFALQMQRPFETTAIITMVSQTAALAAAVAAPFIIRRDLVRTAAVLAMLTLPLRGVIAWAFSSFGMIYPVQLLDGLGVGLLGILTPFLVERLTRGSGHFNLALAAVMVVQGVGAASSNMVAGYLVTHYGYSVTYLLHGAMALVALAALLPALRPARPDARR
ncbi:MFS transporter [Janthinobacterium psychrotolerans]|uniref:Putative arabinose efflux permease, MFS family n=1 Tax=Janthinobacterium psychrotolerans TaxID=1747903 RepID=A0A1A7C6K9_9BURK|nr:MFS transporter [Janthinobacterium psychrotolerans]OBV41541.1 putative arabinose efflux permease, MFS family [Janthinobacterium psychrotolerans]